MSMSEPGAVMTIHKRILPLTAGLLICAGGVVWALSKAKPDSGPAPTPTATGPAAHGFAGSPSCSARYCHGGDQARDNVIAQQDEYTFFVMHDKHAQAYGVLLS